MIRRIRRHSMLAALLVAIVPAMTACDDDDPMEVEEEPEVASMRITVGSQVINVDDTGAVTGGPIVISVGSTNVSVQFLNADGEPDDHVNATEFEVQVESDDTGIVTFTRNSAFAGTLNGLAAGSTVVAFALFHLEEQHEDFGPFDVQVTVQ